MFSTISNLKLKHKLLSKKSLYHPMIWWYWWCWWWRWWWWWGWWWYSGAEAGGCPENEPPGGPQDVCHAPLPWSPSFDKLSGYDVDGHLGDYKGDDDDDAIFCFLISKLGCEVKSRAIKELQLVSRALQLALHQIVTASLFCIRLSVLPCSVLDCLYFFSLHQIVSISLVCITLFVLLFSAPDCQYFFVLYWIVSTSLYISVLKIGCFLSWFGRCPRNIWCWIYRLPIGDPYLFCRIWV